VHLFPLGRRAQALGALAGSLPRPVALEQVARPLLARLAGPPKVALALLAAGAALGPAAAARHLVPPLLAAATCRAPAGPPGRARPASAGGAAQRAPHSCGGLDGGHAGASADVGLTRGRC